MNIPKIYQDKSPTEFKPFYRTPQFIEDWADMELDRLAKSIVVVSGSLPDTGNMQVLGQEPPPKTFKDDTELVAIWDPSLGEFVDPEDPMVPVNDYQGMDLL